MPFLGATNQKAVESHPHGGVQSLTAPGPLTLACLQAPASQERHRLKKLLYPQRERTPPPAALAGSLTARPLGTPWFQLKNHHMATARGRPPNMQEGTSLNTLLPATGLCRAQLIVFCSHHLTLGYVSDVPCPLLNGISALEEGGPEKEEEDEEECGESLWQGVGAFC